MSYIVLARKYRPQTFSEVYAQEHITDILQNAIKTQRIHHAYLFNGPRGVGKTSLARILAKSLNCEEGPTLTPCNKCSNCVEITASTSTDVIEIDGASNNSVDDIRDLQSELMYAPSQSNYKIYIIDEVHMLSKNAFNALLKTLEEPPENVIFIFATTEPHKVLPTIVSRCQRFDFKRIPVDSIVKRIRDLAAEEHVTIDNESIYMIARKADGGLRDALSLMDQVLSYCMSNVTIDKVREIFGMLPAQVLSEMLTSIHQHDTKELVIKLQQVFEQGTELQEFVNSFMDFLRIVLLRKLGIKPNEINPDELSLYDESAAIFSRNDLMYIMSALMQTKSDIRSSANPQLILEVLMIKLSRMDEMNEISEILSKLDTIKSAAYSIPVPVQAAAPMPQRLQNAMKTQPAPTPVHVSEKPVVTYLELSEDTLKEQWQKIINRVKHSGTNTTSISLSKARIKSIEGKRIDLEVEGSSFADPLRKNKDLIEKVLQEIFGTGVQITINQLETAAPTSVTIKRRSIEDLKKENPDLTNYIELTDSKLISG